MASQIDRILASIDIRAIKAGLAARPELLKALSDDERREVMRTIIQIEDSTYRDDPYGWVTEQAFTIDEADNQIKRFPDKAYLKDLYWLLEHERLLAIMKSRRMLVSWAVALFNLHDIRYHKHVAGFIQSATEEKSAYILKDRMVWAEDHLIEPYRRGYDFNKSQWRLTFHRTGSYSQAVAQGGDVFRAFTPSFVFMDEIEFMEKGHESFVAALPFAEKKARIVLVSSSNGPHGVLADMAREAGFQRF